MPVVAVQTNVDAGSVIRRSRGRRYSSPLGAHVFGFLLVAGVAAFSFVGPSLIAHDPLAQDVSRRLMAPVWEAGRADHLLGTDHLGRDILARLALGGQVSLTVGFVAVAVAGVLGLLVGLISGYVGGWLDTLLMGIADAELAFPFILLAIAVIVALGPSLQNVIIVLGLTGWVAFARPVRGMTFSVREKEYVEAARAVGAPPIRIIRKHIFPQVLPTAIVIANLQFAQMILSEAALSFLGLGVQPPFPSWGSMVSDGRNYIWENPWLIVLPGLCISATVLGITYTGDWARRTLDPKYRGF